MMRKTIPMRAVLPALISGFMMTCAFPKVGMAWLAWLALVPLLTALNDLSPKQGFMIGLVAGLAHNLTVFHWLGHTMKTYGHLPWYLCAAILVLFSIYLSLFPAVFSAVLIRLAGTPVSCLFMIPFLWVGVDYIRSFLFTGFPWAFIGYSQYDQLPVIQIADLFGVYGVSFWIAAVNGVIFFTLLVVRKKDWQGKRATIKCLGWAWLTVAFMSSLIGWYGHRQIRLIDRLASASDTIPVSVVQGNIDQKDKWDPAFQKDTVSKYVRLSYLAKSNSPHLMVWPETATPFYLWHDKRMTEIVQAGIRRAGTDFLIGSPSFVRRNNAMDYHNSAFLIGSDGQPKGKYDKVHLVPFGEYVPFQRWFPFLGKIVAHVGDFKPGEKGRALPWGDYRLGVQICYEIIFPSLSRILVENGADVILNMTNDAWYGDSGAPYQHFSMAIFRAVENRRPLVRSANTGISGFVDPTGRVMAATPLFEESVITQSVRIVDQKTVYTRYGDLFAVFCVGAVLAMAAFRQVERSGRNRLTTG